MWGQRRQGKRGERRFRLFSSPNPSEEFVGGIYLYIMARSARESSMETDVAGQRPGYISIAAVKPIYEVFFHDPLLLSMPPPKFPPPPPVVFLLAAGLPLAARPRPPWAEEPEDSCSELNLDGPAPCSSPPAR